MKHYTITVFAHRIALSLLCFSLEALKMRTAPNPFHFHQRAKAPGVIETPKNKNTCFNLHGFKGVMSNCLKSYRAPATQAELFVDFQSKCGMHNGDIDCHQHA